MQGLLAIELVKSYRKRRVVNRVSLSVREGEIVGLLGPNGAGKTTVFSMVVGLERPESGRIFLQGQDVTHLPMSERARRGIGYLPQEPSIFRKLTVYENLMAVLEMTALSRLEQQRKAEALMEELDLAGLRGAYGYALSGGERRRVEICRALATSPAFILLDEPFSGIDPIAVQELQRILGEQRRKRIGLLITDHNVHETLAVTDRAYIISEGNILVSGTPGEVAASEKARRIYFGEKFQMPAAGHAGQPGLPHELGAEALFEQTLLKLLHGQEEITVAAQEIIRVAEELGGQRDFLTETWIQEQMVKRGLVGNHGGGVYRKYVARAGRRTSIPHYRVRRSSLKQPAV
ncbi:MAG: LPS export ABC transporter ATP-binding protein [Candidatus Tectomicrobia bacterium]|nr:LPS export ABC transporter ATP-binding protein [Candidatus Tectomicrobia bacterium]